MPWLRAACWLLILSKQTIEGGGSARHRMQLEMEIDGGEAMLVAMAGELLLGTFA